MHIHTHQIQTYFTKITQCNGGGDNQPFHFKSLIIINSNYSNLDRIQTTTEIFVVYYCFEAKFDHRLS